MIKSRYAMLGAASVAVMAATVLIPGVAHAAGTETYGSIGCVTNQTLKNEGYYFAFSAHGNDYPAKVRIEIEYYRSSSSPGTQGKDGDLGETTTSSNGIWSSNTEYDGGIGFSGGNEQLDITVVEVSNGKVLGRSTQVHVAYNNCSPINY